MRTNIVLAVLSIIFLAVALAFDVNYMDYGSPIPYSDLASISLDNFKGLARPGLTLDGQTEFAYIATNREISYPSDTAVEITTFFYPSRSYVYNRNIRSAGLLTHELYHFHITEYFTRLIKADILQTERKISRSEIRKIAMKYFEMENAMQVQYDDETYHSYVLKEQKRWETKIDERLWTLNKFSAPTVSLHR
jgi:hypothetical protein